MTIKHLFLSLVKKHNYFDKLVIRNTGYSSKAFALVVIVLLSAFLVGILAAGLIVDLVYNHTFTINLSDAALFLGAISTMIASIAIPKSLTDRNKNGVPDEFEDSVEETNEEIIVDGDD